jgi:hypothetical protein
MTKDTQYPAACGGVVYPYEDHATQKLLLPNDEKA